jgi:hypothetical protein
MQLIFEMKISNSSPIHFTFNHRLHQFSKLLIAKNFILLSNVLLMKLSLENLIYFSNTENDVLRRHIQDHT